MAHFHLPDLRMMCASAMMACITATLQAGVFDTYEFTPAADKPVARIDNLRIVFPDGDFNTDTNKTLTSDIKLSGYEKSFTCVDLSGFGSIWTMGFNSNDQASETEAVITPGIYTLTIPAGVFKQGSEYTNNEITATFIVSDDIDFAWTAYPPTGSEKEIPQYGDIDISFSFTGCSSVSLTPFHPSSHVNVTLGDTALEAFQDLGAGEGYRLTASGTQLRLQVSKSLVNKKKELVFQASKGAFTIDGIASPAIEYRVSYMPPSIMPPYLNTFDTAADAEGFTIIDLSGDDRTWEWHESEYPEGTLTQEMRCWDNGHKDDWLISPAMYLEAGKTYKFSIFARPYGFWSEDFEVKMGDAPTVEAMTYNVIDKVHMRDGSKGEGTFHGYVTPETSGAFHFGIHAMIPADGFYLHIDNLAVSAPLESTLPESVSDLNISIDSRNSRKAHLTFNAPTEDIAGNTLTDLTKIEVFCDGELIETFENPAPGADLECISVVNEPDDYRYDITTYGSSGEGKSVTRIVYVGLKKPSYPTNVRAVETDKPGEVLITWDAPTADIDGDPIDPSLLTYYIVYLEGDNQIMLKRYHKGTSLLYQAVDSDGEQRFMSFGVFAETEGGISNGTQSRLIPLGVPYTLPYSESFDVRNISLIAVATLSGNGEWGIYGESEGKVPAYDNDDSYAGMAGDAKGDKAILYTGKISLADCHKPELSFQVYNFGDIDGKPYSNTLEVSICCDGYEFTPLTTLDLSDMGSKQGWHEKKISLESVKGKNIQLGFTGTIDNHSHVFIDALHIEPGESSVSSLEAQRLKVAATHGTINVVNPAADMVKIISLDGIVIYSGNDHEIQLNVPAGIYAVGNGRTTAKVIVR